MDHYQFIFYDEGSVEKYFMYIWNSDFYTVMKKRKELTELERDANKSEIDFDIYEQMRRELHCYFAPITIWNINSWAVLNDYELE